VEYALPGGWLGDRLAGQAVLHKLQRVFSYRHRTLQLDMQALQPYRESKPMNILISGATGLVGSELTAFLTAGGHQVTSLSRSAARDATHRVISWDPAAGKLEGERLNGFDAVVHLAGESIVGRWTAAKKQRIYDSRIQGTKLLCEALARQPQPPRVLVSTSAIGYYGDRGDEELTEESAAGDLFLSRVCQDWEKATASAADRGIRVVQARLGVVLSPRGGALAKMLTPFRLGGGGVFGSGKQWMSWITLDDVVAAIYHLLQAESLRGPVNMVTPNPVTNRDFTKTLGRVLHRPTLFPMPTFAARLAFGQMADEMLLCSERVLPTRLQSSGYVFRHPQLEEALRFLLGKEQTTQQPAAPA
jgi:uncharacterized protein (TIGR01777 family)